MAGGKQRSAFGPADILLPQNCAYETWAVASEDSYVAQPEYWRRIERCVGSAPSALKLIMPESCMDSPNLETDVMEINNRMTAYLRESRFQEIPDTLLYIERTLGSGKTRKGLVGPVDLESYDDMPDAPAAVRPMEATETDRLPQYVTVRKNAPIELSDVLLFLDDPQQVVMEYLMGRKAEMTPLYSFDLMEAGGHLSGWALDSQSVAEVSKLLEALFSKREEGVQFLVGEGSRSLSAAKECYERQKRLCPPERWASLPSRYALCELVSLYDPALELELFHPVVEGVCEQSLLEALCQNFSGEEGTERGCVLRYLSAGQEEPAALPIELSLKNYRAFREILGRYIAEAGGNVYFVRGAGVARGLGRQKGNMAFLLPPLRREEVFQAVFLHGALPATSVSFGRPADKRFFLEGRKIR